MISYKFQVPGGVLPELDAFFDENGFGNVSLFENASSGFSDELDDNGFPIAKFFDVEIFTDSIENPDKIKNLLGKQIGNNIISFQVETVDKKDWVDNYLKELKPVICGGFYLYNEFTQQKPENKELVPIKINSALAFGSGHHQTTQACLLNMLHLAEQMRFAPKSILDMGCGTGVLGICALKIWSGASLLGIDIDPEAVEITRANYISNNVVAEAIVGSNLANIKRHYDLVFCNILQRPLIDLCLDFWKAMASGAYIITSGYIVSQEKEVAEHYVKSGFEVANRMQMDDWVSVIFRKK